MKCIFRIIRKFYAKDMLTPLKTERVGIKQRLKASAKKDYIVKVAITFKGKPVSMVSMRQSGYSRDGVAGDIQKNAGLKVVSAHKVKKSQVK